MAEALHLELLGGLRITRRGEPVTGFVSSKASALLVYLAVTGRPHFRSALAAILWSDLPEASARMNLRHILSNLRHLLEPHLVITRDTIAFNRASSYWLDVEQFETALHSLSSSNLSHLRAAVDVYHGEFLAGFYVRDAPDFEEWAAIQRERLHRLVVQALHALMTYYTAEQEYATAIDYGTRLLALEPWREEAHQQVMTLLVLSGQRRAALAQYDLCQRVLAAELGVEPSAETMVLYQRILAGDLAHGSLRHLASGVGRRPSDQPATVPAPGSALPVQPTPLVGRSTELAQISAYLLNPTIRLLTLLGPGGVGKTRLALEAATQQQNSFADGVYWVDLAPLRDPALLVAAVAQALGVRESNEQQVLEALKAWLRGRHLLLLLDNFEHLLAAAPIVSELLASSSQVHVLISSRAVLHLRGEQQIHVRPLALPDLQRLPAHGRDCAALIQYSAVELFVARAVSVQPSFALTDANAAAVAEICVRLDGLPLAIELAAARVTLFAPEALLARLDRRLGLLTSGARDLPARQQTLRAAIGWSYDLLDAAEQALFRRLAVFAGGCTLDAAQTVCNLPGGAGADRVINIIDAVESLVNQSLLHLEKPSSTDLEGEPRLSMLETIREYGLEQLTASGEVADVRRQHAQFFLQLAEMAESELTGAHQMAWLRRLKQEHNNLRVALTWSQQAGAAELGLRLAGVLWWFWSFWGYFSEGRHWLEAALMQTVAGDGTLARVKALLGAGSLALAQGDYVAGRTRLEACMALGRNLGALREVAYACARLGLDLALVQGNPSAGRAELDESERLFREVGDTCGLAFTLRCQAMVVLPQDDPTYVQAWLAESEAIFRTLGNRWGLALVRSDVAMMAYQHGNYPLARAAGEESAALAQRIGNRPLHAVALKRLALTSQAQGDYLRALTLHCECLRLAHDLGRGAWDVADVLGNMAWTLHQLGDHTRAAQLISAAAVLRETSGVVVPPREQAEHDCTIAAIQCVLGDAAFAEAWGAGRALTVEQVIATALDEVS